MLDSTPARKAFQTAEENPIPCRTRTKERRDSLGSRPRPIDGQIPSARSLSKARREQRGGRSTESAGRRLAARLKRTLTTAFQAPKPIPAKMPDANERRIGLLHHQAGKSSCRTRKLPLKELARCKNSKQRQQSQARCTDRNRNKGIADSRQFRGRAATK